MIGWQHDKQWSDKFLDEIKSILGRQFITAATRDEDLFHNTDLMVLRMDTIRIACRIRRFWAFPSYHSEFTLRSARPSGNKTELEKVIEGWGDYIFYGFANRDETALKSWIIGDLRVFRSYCMSHMAHNHGRMPGSEQWNHDNSSCFRSFRIKDLPRAFIINKGLSERIICAPAFLPIPLTAEC